MGFLGGVKNVVGFLTIFPVGMDPDGLRQAAAHVYLFPAVGALLGAIAGGFAWLAQHGLPQPVLGVLTLGVLEILTGFHHLDGLLDFGDGVMATGPREKKIDAMRDQNLGTGGLASGIIVFLTTALSLAKPDPLTILLILVVAETSAKFSMVVVAATGKSAREGMNTPFVELTHGRTGTYRQLTALAISIGVCFVALEFIGLVMLAVSIATALIMVAAAQRHFGGVTGDVFGATNEIARMIAILGFLVVINWL